MPSKFLTVSRALMVCCWCVVIGLSEASPFASPAIRGDEGTVILHGGGNVSRELRDRFFELAGGRKSQLIVIPTADPETPDDDGRLVTWRAREPKSLALLHAESREHAEKADFATPLKTATGVWISGGRQTILASRYLQTDVERELSALLKRGGVIAGTSAGAAIQSRVMIVRGEIREGFDLVPDAIVDQHFVARDRQDRLLSVLRAHPQRFGIGVDEDTAAIIRGDRLDVLGTSTVTICTALADDEPHIELLKPGQAMNLKSIRAKVRSRK